jgi:hypothetical protein
VPGQLRWVTLCVQGKFNSIQYRKKGNFMMACDNDHGGSEWTLSWRILLLPQKIWLR